MTDTSKQCLKTEEIEFTVTLRNTGRATLTHIALRQTEVGLPAGTTAGRLLESSPSAACQTGLPYTGVTCSVPELQSGAEIFVKVAFVPQETASATETISFPGLTATAKAATTSGPKTNFTNFEETCAKPCTTVQFATAEDAQGQTHSVSRGGQTTNLTLPATADPEELNVFLHQIVDLRFCGSPAIDLGTCFGQTSAVVIEDVGGNPYTFEDCDPSLGALTDQCIKLEIIWDLALLPELYRTFPALINVYHDGVLVPKCPAVTADLSACSTVALLDAGRIVITAYADRNGNWGGG